MVIQSRAFGILRLEENRNTKENVIRYTRQNVLGTENIDIASSWEEVVQVLEVLVCRPDKDEIQRQISAKLTVNTPEAKQVLSQQLTAYLEQRKTELEQNGGTDSPDYKREATIIQNLIIQHGLKIVDINEQKVIPQNPEDTIDSLRLSLVTIIIEPYSP